MVAAVPIAMVTVIMDIVDAIPRAIPISNPVRDVSIGSGVVVNVVMVVMGMVVVSIRTVMVNGHTNVTVASMPVTNKVLSKSDSASGVVIGYTTIKVRVAKTVFFDIAITFNILNRVIACDILAGSFLTLSFIA